MNFIVNISFLYFKLFFIFAKKNKLNEKFIYIIISGRIIFFGLGI
jgi:hypothetical protein